MQKRGKRHGNKRRYSSAAAFEAIRSLNDKNPEKAKEEFALNSFQKKELKSFINEPVIDNEIARLLLAKYVKYVKYVKYENISRDDVAEQILDLDKATLEHVIPQNPARNSNWLSLDKDFRKNYTYRLGNMTLLTRKMNAAAKNYDFSIKKKEYAHTNLNLTKELAGLDSIDKEFIKKRHEKIVKGICKDLGL